jgi:hypothetical protein
LQYRESYGAEPRRRAIKLGPAEQGRGRRETGRLRQEPAHFELGVDASLQLANHLQDRAVADANGGVRLFGAAPTDGPAAGWLKPGPGQLFRSPGPEAPCLRDLAIAPQQSLDPGADEGVHREGLYQPHLPTTVGGIRRRRGDHLRRVCHLGRDQRERHEEEQRRLPGRRHPPDNNRRRNTGNGERQQRGERNLRSACIFRRIPSPPQQEFRQGRERQCL